MKIFHLSDLHIGKTVKNHSMIPEQEYIFRTVIDLIASEKPDCLVIAGDIYDRAAPGVEAVNLFDAFLTDLSALNLPVLITGGNHDSPERLNFGSRIMSRNNIHICSVFDGMLRKITLRDVDFYLLPYIRPGAVRKYFSDSKIESHDDAVRAIIESADIDYSRRCVIIAHQFFISKGTSPERSDSENISVGGLEAVETDVLKGFDYAALGHIHRRQNIVPSAEIGYGHIYYSGSPLKYSASEYKDKKGIISITLNEKGKAEIDILPLCPANDLRVVTGKIDELIAAAQETEDGRNDYIFAVLTDDGEIIDAMDKMRAVYPNMMEISYENHRYDALFDLNISSDIETEKILSPEDMFAEFFAYQNGYDPSERQKEIIKQILNDY